MGSLSRDSGADGERMVRDLFRQHGYNKAERGCQRDGRTGHADVEGVPGLHIEVKFWMRFTRGDLVNAMRQSERDAAGYFENTGEEIIPIVVHKRKGAHGWNVSISVAWLLQIIDANIPFSLDYPDAIATFTFDDFMMMYMPYEQRDRWRTKR